MTWIWSVASTENRWSEMVLSSGGAPCPRPCPGRRGTQAGWKGCIHKILSWEVRKRTAGSRYVPGGQIVFCFVVVFLPKVQEENQGLYCLPEQEAQPGLCWHLGLETPLFWGAMCPGRMFNRRPGFYPLGTNSSPLPRGDNQTLSPDIASLGEQGHPVDMS